MPLEDQKSALWRHLRRGIGLRLAIAIAVALMICLAIVWQALDRPRRTVQTNSVAPTLQTPVQSTVTQTTRPGPGKINAPQGGPAVATGVAPHAANTGPSRPTATKKAASDSPKPRAVAPAATDALTQENEGGVVVAPVLPLPSRPDAKPQPQLPSGPYLQVGVFTHPDNAAELKARLEAQGMPVQIASRVQVGPFKNKSEAEHARVKLKAMGIESVLITQ